MTGAEVRIGRIAAGLTQTQLAAALDVDVRTVGRWERGESPILEVIAIAIDAIFFEATNWRAWPAGFVYPRKAFFMAIGRIAATP